MSRFLYSIDGAAPIEKDVALPFTIASTAAQSVTVTPLGQPVTNQGTVSGNVLTLAYDPSNPSTDVQATTNTAGTLRWAITTSMTPPSPAEITTGTGFYAAGTVNTVAGTLGIELPALSGAPDLFFHAFVDGAAADTNVATARVYIGTNSAFATIGSTTGNPTMRDYTDGDGVNWRSYEWTQSGGFTVSAGGGVEYELIAGGGGGGGGANYNTGGGGGAGGRLTGTRSLTPATYALTVGAGGVGRANGGAATSGGDTTIFDQTAIGGGLGGTAGFQDPGSGGSGGGRGLGTSGNFGAGTPGQGYKGGGSVNGSGASGVASGGGGFSGEGGTASVDGNGVRRGGTGGSGIVSLYTGTATGVCGGGSGSAEDAASSRAAATHGGGRGSIQAGGQSQAGENATGPGGGGGGGGGATGTGGAGFRGRVVIRVKR